MARDDHQQHRARHGYAGEGEIGMWNAISEQVRKADQDTLLMLAMFVGIPVTAMVCYTIYAVTCVLMGVQP